MIVIKGVRRTGKSSLLNVGLRISGIPYMIFDVRRFMPISMEKFYDVFGDLLTNFYRRNRGIKSVLDKVRGIGVYGFRVEFTDRNMGVLTNIIDMINEWGRKRNTFIALAFDEAQYLRMLRGIEELLAHIYDYCDNIKLILTGSEVGILDKLLGVRRVEAPLYGRAYVEIIMRRLADKEAIEFLKLGFNQAGKFISEDEIKEVVYRLGGIIGWLTAYGYYRIRMNREGAMEKVIQEGSSTVKKEILNFLSNRLQARDRYLTILKSLDESMSWN